MSAADAVSAAVDGPRLMAHCAEFAKRVKLSGTPEELESVRYLKVVLDADGYRTELISHEAYISLPGPAKVEAAGRTLVAITHSFSRASPAGGLRARIVDVGAGTDFAGEDLRGTIVLIDGIASPAAAARAAAAGAAGQLHVSPHEHLHEMCISPVWGNPSGETLDRLPTTVACTISAADGAALREALTKGPVEARLHAEVDTGWRPTPLLVAELDGPAPGGPFILLSGHHDTWHLGVMDNGSANATMLEAARVLKARRDEWRRGLRLCFWSGHSHGRYSGSAWYVDRHWRELDRRCAAHVNVDSTGGIGATVMTENGVVASLAGLARAAIEAETGQLHEGIRPGRNSDQSFWGIGIPSLYGSVSHQPPGPVAMRNPLGWWWHTPHDTLDKVDEAFLVRDTRVVARSLWHLLADPVLPIDVGAHLRSLVAELEPLGEPAAPLAETARGLAARADALKTAGADAAVMAVCRALVPLDYTEGDRFRHDPALPQPAWPVLEPLRALTKAAPGSDEARFLAVGATRAVNRLVHALDEVERALEPHSRSGEGERQSSR